MAHDLARVLDRPRRRRGKASRAADGRPREARRPVRRQLPAGRLRALEPRQRRVPPDRGADPVQEPQPRPARRDDVAAVAAARQLRDARAGPDAPRAALVRGLGRRDLPEPEPDLRRAAGLHLRLRRRPHLPHGPAADGRAAHRARRRRHRGGHPRADRERGRVRRDRAGAGRRPIRAFREKPYEPGRHAGPPRRGARVDGQLRLHGGRADRRGHARRRRRDVGPRPRRRHHPGPRRARRGLRAGTSPTAHARARASATAATGATSGRSTPTTTRTWT